MSIRTMESYSPRLSNVRMDLETSDRCQMTVDGGQELDCLDVGRLITHY